MGDLEDDMWEGERERRYKRARELEVNARLNALAQVGRHAIVPYRVEQPYPADQKGPRCAICNNAIYEIDDIRGIRWRHK